MTDTQPDEQLNASEKRFSFARFMLRVLVVITLLGGVAGGAGYYWLKLISVQPGPHDSYTLFVVKKGAGRIQLKHDLMRAGVISEPFHYHLVSLFHAADYMPKAGEYRIPPGASLRQILALFDSGRTYQRRVTILEGWRSVDVMKALNSAEALESVVLRPPAEGSVFPDTYFYSHGDDRRALVQRMQRKMEITAAEIWSNRQEGLPLRSVDELIILASMIEKETGRDGERVLVSSVFINRLNSGMRLQSDPTVAYGLAGDGPLPEALSRDDLRITHGWNTYRKKGLPKTAIANPSQASLYAAAHPDASDYLYFVADAKGGHLFARTLAEHNRNVRLYRKRRAQSE